MTVSRMRVAKSETRDMAERDRVQLGLLNEPTEWERSNAKFFIAFVVIVALLAVLALALR
ncbi:MAG: hypothetical protein HOV81_33825 [Kofleriaceae bacterium]|nr:hypothetical protein [Kofleriaceae bacterium]